MKQIPIAAAIAVQMLFATVASAALNTDAVRLALNSLLVATSKMSVVNAMNRTGKPPANNAEAQLGTPNTMTTNEISSIVVANGVINVYLAPNTGTDRGLVQLVPKIVKDPKGGSEIGFVCNSPNIPDIGTVAPSCKYAPRN